MSELPATVHRPTGLDRRRWLLVVAAAVAAPGLRAQVFDQRHAAWNALLRRHVVPLRGGQASQVRYAGFQADRAALLAYRDSLSSVSEAAFKAFDKPQQMAFLINAYNASTIELVLTKFPALASIKDLGSVRKSHESTPDSMQVCQRITVINFYAWNATTRFQNAMVPATGRAHQAGYSPVNRIENQAKMVRRVAYTT